MMASEGLILIALGTIAIGSGLYLPSLPSQIDSLYRHDDPRRKSAYSVYYVGVNLGAFAAPIVIGTVGERYNFHWGFSLAGLGMIAGLVTYIAGARYLPADPGRYSTTAPSSVPASPSLQTGIARRFVLLIAVAATVVIFRGAYEQLGNTVSLWADQSVDRAITPTHSIPVTWFQSLNPLLVFVFTPVLVIRWTRLARQGRDLSSAMKMVIGASIVGASYLLVAAVAFRAQQHDLQVGWPWMAAFIVAMTAGELYILPVGLGLFGRLAPRGLAATTIALWFSAGFLGNLLAGWLGTLWSALSHGAFFSIIGAVALAGAVMLALLVPKVTEMERGKLTL
jgi:proton-dependent oligopeptide transporter, POT family